ncbi:MAG: hypothetical protein JWO67_2253 [Streptosporangiaceae bacterium]|nr:hypothetical protein [Streptosporangiaceae bacterium]
MAIEIPDELAELQRAASAAFEAVPSDGWPQARAAADALRVAIDASGMELGNGYEFQRALKQAARES